VTTASMTLCRETPASPVRRRTSLTSALLDMPDTNSSDARLVHLPVVSAPDASRDSVATLSTGHQPEPEIDSGPSHLRRCPPDGAEAGAGWRRGRGVAARARGGGAGAGWRRGRGVAARARVGGAATGSPHAAGRRGGRARRRVARSAQTGGGWPG